MYFIRKKKEIRFFSPFLNLSVVQHIVYLLIIFILGIKFEFHMFRNVTNLNQMGIDLLILMDSYFRRSVNHRGTMVVF